MKTFPRTISAAVTYLAGHPELRANPRLLMAACAEWDAAMIRQIDRDSSLIPITPEMVSDALHWAGVRAAQEVAMPCKKIVIDDDEMINPEDFK